MTSLAQIINRQRHFSLKTFGPGPRTEGLIDHIEKELKEIAAAPHDLKEWVDVMILAMDGAWRAGYTPEEIVAALCDKQSVNEGRQWPDWRTADKDKAIEHVREALEKCPKCDGTGEVFSGYYGHPETSDGGPMMYRCSLCGTTGKVPESAALEYRCSKILDPY